MELRAKSISYSRKKRVDVKKREIALQQNLDELDYKICNDADLNPRIVDQYEAEKNELNSLYELKGFFHYILIQYRQDHNFKNVKTKLLVNTHIYHFSHLFCLIGKTSMFGVATSLVNKLAKCIVWKVISKCGHLTRKIFRNFGFAFEYK